MNFSLSLTAEQLNALEHVLGCVYDNERDKGTDGIGNDMLESIEHHAGHPRTATDGTYHWDIPFHIAGLLEFFIDCYGDLTYYVDEAETQEQNAETVLAPVRAQLLMSDPIETSVLRFAIEALNENWTEYYRDQIPEYRRQELECLQRIAENIRDADQIKLMVAQKMEEN